MATVAQRSALIRMIQAGERDQARKVMKAAWPELFLDMLESFSDTAVRTAVLDLGTAAGGGGVISWQNPLGVLSVARVLVRIDTPQSGQTLDVGRSVSATGTGTDFASALSLASAGVFETNWAGFGATDYLVAAASGTPSALVGKAIVHYFAAS